MQAILFHILFWLTKYFEKLGCFGKNSEVQTGTLLGGAGGAVFGT